MPDKWAQYAVPADKWAQYAAPSSDTPAVPAGVPAGVTLGQPAAHPAVTMRGGEGNLETIPASQSQPGVLGAVQTGVHNFGARVANNGLGLLKPVLHPIQTGNEILQRGAFPITPDAIRATQYNPSGPDAGATAANVLGDVATAGLLHTGGKAVPPALQRIGESSQDTGASLLNKTGGMLKSDFKRGANGGRAYLEAGGGPALSMQGLADKAADLKGNVGKQLGEVRNAATKAGVVASPQDVAATLNPAIAKGIDLETGAGGAGNTGSIENYSASFRPTLQSGIANGGISPNALAELKGRIADNTNWSDPSQFNLKAIRQQNVGGLSGLENKLIPEAAPLKTQFQGLGKFAARTADRAAANSMPLTSLAGKGILSSGGALIGGLEGHSPLAVVGGGLAGLALDSVPVKSSLATGLYRGGGLLKDTGGVLLRPSPFLPAAAVAPYNLTNKKDRSSNQKPND
jgi:hypothetical protein